MDFNVEWINPHENCWKHLMFTVLMQNFRSVVLRNLSDLQINVMNMYHSYL